MTAASSSQSPSVSAAPLIEVENLAVDFHTAQGSLKAIRDLSFKVYPGEIFGIVGESGAGKSVCAYSILQLLPQNAHIRNGDIRYRGDSLLGYSAEQLRVLRGSEIGLIFQEPSRSFDPIYPIGKSMAETLRVHNPAMPHDEITHRTIELLEEVNIPSPRHHMQSFPHQLSGGMLQRIMIALALCASPSVLIADEPTTSLDVTIQAEIIKLMLRLQQNHNLSIIFISHNLALIAAISTRIIVMYNGLVMEEGTTADILTHPCHPYTRALLESVPNLGIHNRTHTLYTIEGTPPPLYQIPAGCPFEPRCQFAHPECRHHLPPFVQESHSTNRYRCIIPGPKTAAAASAADGKAAD